MKRILFVTNDFLPMIGGVAHHVNSLADALVDFDYEVKVFHICYNEEYLQEATNSRYEIIRVCVSESLANRNTLYAKFMRYVTSLTTAKRELKKVVKSFKPDVVHWHDYYHSSLTTKTINSKSTLLVCTNHASQFLEQYKKKYPMHFYLKMLVSHAHGLIGTSEELTHKSQITQKPVTFIPNGVNGEIFKPTKRHRRKTLAKYNIGSEFKLILAPRRLDRKNGIDVLIKSMPEILNKNEKVMVIIAGGGDIQLYKEYQSLANNLGVSQNLLMIGAIQHEEMQFLIPSADIVVIPSYHEAVSLAALESLACGVPVIASNVGGLPFIINKTNGGIFEAGNHKKLSLIINHHLDNWAQTKEKGRASRSSIIENYTWKAVAQKTLKFYDELNKNR